MKDELIPFKTFLHVYDSTDSGLVFFLSNCNINNLKIIISHKKKNQSKFILCIIFHCSFYFVKKFNLMVCSIFIFYNSTYIYKNTFRTFMQLFPGNLQSLLSFSGNIYDNTCLFNE